MVPRVHTSTLSIALQHLQYMVAAADSGSFRQAAEVMAVRQSTLSRSIRQLEHLIGVPIFERSSAGVTPTPTGRTIVRMAKTILEELEVLVTTARSTRNHEIGRLSVGFCTSLTAGNLRVSLIDFKSQFPRIELAIVEQSRARLAVALRSGVLDILIVTGAVPLRDTKSMSLWSERVLAILPEDHPLTARETIYWTDLRDEKVLLSGYDPGCEFEDLVVSKLISPEERPKIERHDVSQSIINSLISMKSGISLVLESDIGANVSGLVYRELRDGTGPSRVGYSAYWQADNENPALDAYLRLLAVRHPRPI